MLKKALIVAGCVVVACAAFVTYRAGTAYGAKQRTDAVVAEYSKTRN